MSIQDLTLKSVFSLFFSFKGKIKRKPFIYGIILLHIIFGLLAYIFVFLSNFLLPEHCNQEPNKNLVFFVIVTRTVILWSWIYFFLALSVKRLRDCNHSPWVCLWYLVINILLLFYLIFQPSVPAKNKLK